MHPWPSCNGRTRNAASMSIWVYTRPHYFYCPSPDFTNSIVSQSVTNNRCAPSCGGTREKWGAHQKIYGRRFAPALCPPLANCFRRHWTAEDIVKLLSRPCSPIILVFLPHGADTQFQGQPLSGGAKYKGGGEILRFLTEIVVYLRNGTRQAHGCYGTLVGSHIRSVEWRHFQWPWWTLTQFSKSRYFWSWIFQKRCILVTKLL